MISRIANKLAVAAVVAAAGAGTFVFSNTTVAAAETVTAHGITMTVATEIQVADAKAGETAFTRCRACHTVEKGEPNRVGPNLFGVVGRKAGEVAGFNYSPALKGSGLTWTEDNLAKWIQDAPGTVPGNKMNLAKGAVNATQAKDIVEFLETKK
jgi:cytochrome c